MGRCFFFLFNFFMALCIMYTIYTTPDADNSPNMVHLYVIRICVSLRLYTYNILLLVLQRDKCALFHTHGYGIHTHARDAQSRVISIGTLYHIVCGYKLLSLYKYAFCTIDRPSARWGVHHHTPPVRRPFRRISYPAIFFHPSPASSLMS